MGEVAGEWKGRQGQEGTVDGWWEDFGEKY